MALLKESFEAGYGMSKKNRHSRNYQLVGGSQYRGVSRCNRLSAVATEFEAGQQR